MASTKVAIPGQVVGSTSSHIAGPGTHVHGNNIYASIVGPVVTVPPTSLTSIANKVLSKPTLTVSRRSDSAFQQGYTPLPVVGSVVLCTVTRVQSRQAVCLILAILPPVTADPFAKKSIFQPSESLNFPALLRREDIRLTEKDRVVMNDSVRVGDLIRAQVISIGDERQYYISTAGNEYGVLAAKAEGDGIHEGGWMTSVSWKEMRDLNAGGAKGEMRKVAKPV